MATATVTHTFTDATAAEAAEVNTNFSDLVAFINSSTIHKDGSKSFSGDVSFAGNKITSLGNPTADGEAANRLEVKNWASTIHQVRSIGGVLTTSFVNLATISYVLPAAWNAANIIAWSTMGVHSVVGGHNCTAELLIDGVAGASNLLISTEPFTLTPVHIDTNVLGDVTILIRAKVSSSTATWAWANVSAIATRIT